MSILVAGNQERNRFSSPCNTSASWGDELPSPPPPPQIQSLFLLRRRTPHHRRLPPWRSWPVRRRAFSHPAIRFPTAAATTFSSLLRQCAAGPRAIRHGAQIHAHLSKTGLLFPSSPHLGGHLIALYARCGLTALARQVFNELPQPDVVSWSTLISAYANDGLNAEALAAFGRMNSSGSRCNEFTFPSLLKASSALADFNAGRQIHGVVVATGYESDIFVANSLVMFYARLGLMPDVVSWNTLLSSYAQRRYFEEAFGLFREMVIGGKRPNEFTLSCLVGACADAGDLLRGKVVHGCSTRLGHSVDPFTANALVDMYAKLGDLVSAEAAFREIPCPDTVSWNSLMSGLVLHSCYSRALGLFGEMKSSGAAVPNVFTLSSALTASAGAERLELGEQIYGSLVKRGFDSDFFVGVGLIDMYAKCRVEGEEHLRECPFADVVAFTSMISSYTQSGQAEEALKLFMETMKRELLKPDAFVYSSLLNACAGLSAYEQGKQVHAQAAKLGFLRDKFAGNALVFMYAKCGSIDDAGAAFSEIEERETVSWSAIIGGYAQHGRGKEALELFHRMLDDGVEPNHVTLTSVLCACNHAGLVDEATRYFDAMAEDFAINRTQEHYACMVDILGRAGRLGEAAELVIAMPFEANAAVWGALLAAARVHGDVDLGRRAAERLFVLEPDKSGTLVLLANMYAATGMWNDVARVRRLMKDRRVKKEPAMSWIELKGKVHAFVAGDRSHPMAAEIFAKLDELGDAMEKAGYVPMLEADLHDVDRGEKEQLLAHHSERLAVALGLISTPQGATILVKKNLRVCGDCHAAIKLISRIVSREIVIRDINRFHHFRDGSCSCGDYW
ncbi:unnamed protein product [Spirodela intermedia]|uniref:DYW domain-containing protein n=1 Tax=Spirodela intermedia TaxID=51605 RepID=A0A7I8JHZ5_SPIIN|nr:unnamed protein product [Spirodela intermedia]CAA6669052.1 unnamed protein product [Spirodela intermedia]